MKIQRNSLVVAVVVAAFVVSSFAADTRGYVQSGLIAHWDGVENAGRLTHNADATTWTDLVAGRKFTLTGVTVNDDSVTFAGKNTSYGILSDDDTTQTFGVAGSGGTVEIVLKANNANNAVAFQSPTTILGRNGTGSIVRSVSGNKPLLDWAWDAVSTNTVALYYFDSTVQNASVNGSAIAMSSAVNYYSPSGNAAVIGTRQSKGNNHFNGSIYAIRLYDRQLSAAERARNAALDVERFGLGVTAESTDTVLVTSNAEELGAVEPAYGLQANLVDGQSYTYTAPASAADAAGMFTYQCLGWELKQKDGTTTTNTASTVRSCTFTYSAEMDGATLTWRWGNRAVRGDKTYYVDVATGDDEYAGADIGSAEHPFKSLNAAHTATTNYLANNAGQTALISMGEGSYPLTNYITLVKGERIVGAGRDKTGINLRDCEVLLDSKGYGATAYCIKLTEDDNYLGHLSATNFYKNIYNCPKPVWMAKGRVEHYRGAYNYSANNYGYGLGLYMEGGKAQYCLFDHNTGGAMYVKGAGLNISGGECSDSEICYNKDTSGRLSEGQAVRIFGGTVRRCKIHHNNEEATGGLGGTTAGGVYLSGGVLENCLVYKNGIKGAEKVGGIYNKGGTVRFCTIYGNKCSGDTVGYSGFCQVSGTAINNIIFGNFVAGGVVSGGTFVTNLLDAAVSGCADNIVTENPGFTDAANFDFTIPKRSSPAVEHAQPIAAVMTDFVGIERAVKPTIGAYEYDSSKETFEVALQILQTTTLYGTPSSAKAILTGTAGASISIAWIVDGVTRPVLADQEEISLTGLGYGWHSLRVEVTKGGETIHDEKQEALCVLSDRVYVNTTGSGTFPFATAADGTNDICVALDALWQVDAHTSRVEIAEGTYAIDRQVLLKYPVIVTGAGRDKTVVKMRGETLDVRGIFINNAAAVVSGLTVSGFTPIGGVQIGAGVMTDCCITNCVSSGQYHNEGPGVKLTGGSLLNSEVVDCSAGNTYGEGGGVAMLETTALVSNCLVRACYMDSSHGNMGAGVYLAGGLLTHCRITDCGDHKLNNKRSTVGAGLYKYGSSVSSIAATARNVLIDNCSSKASYVVSFTHGYVENCTVAANTTASDVATVYLAPSFDNVRYHLVAMTNMVIWGNSGLGLKLADDIPEKAEKISVGYSCWPEATEGENGNTARDPKLKGANRLYAISSRGSCFRTGAVLDWMTEGATDLMGRPRTTLVGEEQKVDIGCHQVGNDPGLMLLVR